MSQEPRDLNVWLGGRVVADLTVNRRQVAQLRYRDDGAMARTSTRRTKGCPMCKPWKFAGHGDSYRQPPRVQRQFGRTRRWNRHEIPAND